MDEAVVIVNPLHYSGSNRGFQDLAVAPWRIPVRGQYSSQAYVLNNVEAPTGEQAERCKPALTIRSRPFRRRLALVLLVER